MLQTTRDEWKLSHYNVSLKEVYKKENQPYQSIPLISLQFIFFPSISLLTRMSNLYAQYVTKKIAFTDVTKVRARTEVKLIYTEVTKLGYPPRDILS